MGLHQALRLAHQLIGVNCREKAFPGAGSPPEPIVQRDDSLCSIGWPDDVAGPVRFAASRDAVALLRAGQ